MNALFVAALVGVAAYFGVKRYIQGPIFRSDKRLDGQTVLVTGANTGIGLITAQDLYQRGGRVVILCRNDTKGERRAKFPRSDYLGRF